nr:EOG090X0ALT [Ilyocryptus agilis]
MREEDIYGSYAKIIAKYFLAEGALKQNYLFCASVNENPSELINTLPSPFTVSIADDHSDIKENKEELKIAWRYENLSMDNSTQRTGTSFDLSTPYNLTEDQRKNVVIWDGSDKSKRDLKGTFQHTVCMNLLESINETISKWNLQSNSTPNLLRIAILSFGSPYWNFADNGSSDLTSTLMCLKALVRSANAVAIVTVPHQLLNDVILQEVLIERSRNIADIVIRLKSLREDPHLSDLMDVHGILEMKKMTNLTSLKPLLGLDGGRTFPVCENSREHTRLAHEVIHIGGSGQTGQTEGTDAHSTTHKPKICGLKKRPGEGRRQHTVETYSPGRASRVESHIQSLYELPSTDMSRALLWLCFSICCCLKVSLADLRTTEPEATGALDQSVPDAGVVSCECETFIQSWKTSQMIRLPTDDQIGWWDRLYRRACRALLANEYEASDEKVRTTMKNRQVAQVTDNDRRQQELNGPIRGCLQGYARLSDMQVWMPIGSEYRQVLSCPHPTSFKRYRKARSVTKGNNVVNSIDAQTVVTSSITVKPSSGSSSLVSSASQSDVKKPTQFDTAPLRTLLKQFGLFEPYVDTFFNLMNRIGVRDIMDRLRLTNYVDRYYKMYDEYTEEFDVGHCFLEYIIYTVFNNRFSLKNALVHSTPSASRGFEDHALSVISNVVTNFLENENSSQVLSDVFKMIPTRKPSGMPIDYPQQDLQELAVKVARFYFRNYFSTLPGSNVRMDENDPDNNPDSLADMVEQVSRPVFLSVFGVVPGVPASGRLDHLLLIASKQRPAQGIPQSRNKLVPLGPGKAGSPKFPAAQHLPPPTVVKTGNPFFDFGNSIVSTFQRATDATHGLYCAKQYMVNKMWDGFRGTMRRMMRSIPSTR